MFDNPVSLKAIVTVNYTLILISSGTKSLTFSKLNETEYGMTQSPFFINLTWSEFPNCSFTVPTGFLIPELDPVYLASLSPMIFVNSSLGTFYFYISFTPPSLMNDFLTFSFNLSESFFLSPCDLFLFLPKNISI